MTRPKIVYDRDEQLWNVFIDGVVHFSAGSAEECAEYIKALGQYVSNCLL